MKLTDRSELLLRLIISLWRRHIPEFPVRIPVSEFHAVVLERLRNHFKLRQFQIAPILEEIEDGIAGPDGPIREGLPESLLEIGLVNLVNRPEGLLDASFAMGTQGSAIRVEMEIQGGIVSIMIMRIVGEGAREEGRMSFVPCSFVMFQSGAAMAIGGIVVIPVPRVDQTSELLGS